MIAVCVSSFLLLDDLQDVIATPLVDRGGQIGVKEPIVALPGFLVALG